MIANSAGPIASLYYIALGLPKYTYICTSAWLFLLINLLKVPFAIGSRIINWNSFEFSAHFMPYSILGAVIAPYIVKKLNQKLFNFLIWFFIILGGLKLIF